MSASIPLMPVNKFEGGKTMTSAGDDILTGLAERFDRITRLIDSRYSADVVVDTAAPPIQLWNPAFAYFSSNALNPAYHVPREFVREIYGLMKHFDKTGQENIRPFLSKALSSVLSSITNSDGTSPDFVVMRPDGVRAVYLVIQEEKNLFGDGDSDPSTQAAFSYLRLVSQHKNADQRDRCCYPAFIIAHAGPWFSVMGAILTDYCIVQRLTDFVWIPIHSTHNDDHPHRIARIFYALRESIERLYSWYKELDVTPYDHSPVFHQRFWPSPTSFKDDAMNALVKFSYEKPLEDDVSCVTFLAKTLGDNPKDIVVKFVTSYGVDAHQHMASKGFAPRLLYYGEIVVPPKSPSYGKILMVVTEYTKGSTLHDILRDKKRIPPSFKSDLTRAFKHLHGAGYVYGDLRKPNIMILPDDTPSESKVQLINFDWAGMDGEVVYPVGISSTIGVKGLECIKKEHDEAMMQLLMRDLFGLDSPDDDFMAWEYIP